ncbi:MAG: hypothetical protein RLZZ358_1360 [Bacteroidota bacterium]|jgi:hypothetical protein
MNLKKKIAMIKSNWSQTLSSSFLLWVIPFLFLGFGCNSLKVGESWKMLPENQTKGLTLLWELSEADLKKMLPEDQQPRIRKGKGVVMLFLASTAQYTLGDKPNGPLAVAHLLIPLEKHLGIPRTVVSKRQALYSALAQLDFPVQNGEVALTLAPAQDSVQVDGSIQFPTGSLSFSGMAGSHKGNLVDLPLTTLVGKHLDRNFLSGPESYRPLAMSKIKVRSEGENWMTTFGLTAPPDRIWVNVDFHVDFAYHQKVPISN